MSKGPFMVDLRATAKKKVKVYYELLRDGIDIGDALGQYKLGDFTPSQLNAIGRAVDRDVYAGLFAHPYVSPYTMYYLIDKLEKNATLADGKEDPELEAMLKRIPLLAELPGDGDSVFEHELGLYILKDMKYPITEEYSGGMLQELRLGFEQGIDISIYNNPNYYDAMMREYRKLLKGGFDVKPYLEGYVHGQLKQIRKGLESGLDISIYANKDTPYQTMKAMRKCLKKNIPFDKYLEQGLFANDQLQVILTALVTNSSPYHIKNGNIIDIDSFAKPEYSSTKMLSCMCEQVSKFPSVGMSCTVKRMNELEGDTLRAIAIRGDGMYRER